MIEKIDLESIKKLYKKYMETDFPEDERPSYNKYIKLVQSQIMQVYIYKELDKTVAYFSCIEQDGYILITHLAVIKEFRSQGVGKRLLEEIKKYYNDKKALIIESESEQMAKFGRDIETIKKRLNFYKKAEFIDFPNIEYILSDVQYVLLVYILDENTKINDSELMEKIKQIYYLFLEDKSILQIKINKN